MAAVDPIFKKFHNSLGSILFNKFHSSVSVFDLSDRAEILQNNLTISYDRYFSKSTVSPYKGPML
jgi:hypothetical protein